jgi:hypothetical protein
MFGKTGLVFILSIQSLFILCCCYQSSTPQKVEVVYPSIQDQAWFQYTIGYHYFKDKNNNIDTMFFPADTFLNTTFVNYSGSQQTYSSCEPFLLDAYKIGYFNLIRKNQGITIGSINEANTNYHSGFSDSTRFTFTTDPNVNGGFQEFALPNGPDTTLIINKVTYNDCYILTFTFAPSPSNFFLKLYYSKSKAIVKYEKPNGDIYEIEN